jgi:hypothetical protein
MIGKKTITAVVVIAIMCYILGAFYEANIDFTQWKQDTRSCVIGFFVFASVAIGGFTMLVDESDDLDEKLDKIRKLNDELDNRKK